MRENAHLHGRGSDEAGQNRSCKIAILCYKFWRKGGFGIDKKAGEKECDAIGNIGNRNEYPDKKYTFIKSWL